MKQKQVRVAIIGTGNIGSDLLSKIQRSPSLTCVLFAGQNPASQGIARAKAMGVPVSSDSIAAIIRARKHIDIVIDATSAKHHAIHAPILKKLKKFVIDMTPSNIGTLCVPVVNLREGIRSGNVSMISCGGQATIPIIHALSTVITMPYVEIVSSISSRSAGIGTRDNIDEYTQTTSDAIEELAQVKKAKTIIIINSADPPSMMHNTIYIPYPSPDMREIRRIVSDVVKTVKMYTPGYSLIHPPYYDHGRIVIQTQVVGLGDYLPVYAGNLDIINCAAIAVAQGYASRA